MGVAPEPRVGQRRTRVRGRVVVQLRILCVRRERRAVVDDRAGLVALPELHAVRVELGVHRLEPGEQLQAHGFAVGTEDLVEVLRRGFGGATVEHPHRAQPRQHLADALVGAVHHLAPDRLTLGVVGVEQTVAGAAVDDERELPGEVVGVLDRRVAAESVRRRVAVRGVTGDEEAPSSVLPRRRRG